MSADVTPPPEQQPAPQPIAADPITAILVSITEMRGELRAALDVQQRHAADITTLYQSHNHLRDRVVALETRSLADDRNHEGTQGSKALVWAAIASVAAVASLALTVLLSVRGGA